VDKIISIEPGTVTHSVKGFTYTLIVNGEPRNIGDKYFRGATDAKSDMKIVVAWLRNFHNIACTAL
jgi:hypothetical protein